MSTLTAILEPDPDGTLHLPLPEDMRSGKIKIVATLEIAELQSKPSPLGMWKGKLELLPGWNEPLEDLKDYTK
ncbi:hypothetical protein FEM03_06415 [Phragmitibacter flavus]|uniref:DUF2281 domain-containing protein n=1 Tax=Phragmitibacter flavus TaxID=2576071 RepID=A0A5R8KHM4_9BACT|nr:hypothetical protein [Phragmitibacter flavus]TLD71767.1 hypothetical protein FEM03_06415 [Phragmitibacter flavus]